MLFGFHLTMDTLPSAEWSHIAASEVLPLLNIAFLIWTPEVLLPY
jgi:hypothetical protein